MNAETVAIRAVSKAAPWLAPLPTAWIVAAQSHALLGFPWPVAAVAGLTLECAGLAILVTTLELWSWNRAKRKAEPAAPVAVGLVLVGAYTGAALLLTVLMGQPRTVADWAPAVFPLLSLAAMATLALREDQAARAEAARLERDRQREERRAARVEAKAQRLEVAPVAVEAVTEPAYTWRTFLEAFPAMPEMTGKQIGELAGVSERTGNNWKRIARNGNGKERVTA